MHRSLLPFLLASLAFTLVALAVTMPLFEWEISDVVTDFPPNYDVHVYPSPWRAYLGDSLDASLHSFPGGFRIRRDGEFCRTGDLNIAVVRSQNDETLERMLNFKPQTKLWLFAWISIEVVLSVVYIVLYILEYQHGSNMQAIFLMGIAGFICVFLILIMRLFGSLPYYFFPDDFDSGVACYGTITFHAVLSKVHYETLLVLGAGILAEVGALGIVLRQIRRAISEGKESVKGAVG
jgi:hypothetical protein